MKTSTYIAVLAAVVPTAWSLPSGLVTRQFKVPTCGAETCLAATNGTFVTSGASNGTAPSNLGRLCSLPQADLTTYVQTVQPCIDGDAGKAACTEGARVQYKDLLKSVCAGSPYNKDVEWAQAL